MKLSDFGPASEITATAALGHESLLIAKGTRLCFLAGVRYTGIVEYSKAVDLHPTSSFPSPITSIVQHDKGGRVAVSGSNFVWLLSLPFDLWTGPVCEELLQTRYFVETTPVQEAVFSGDANPVLIRWTSDGDNSAPSTYLAVLTADSAIRFYEVDGKLGCDYPKSKIELLQLLPLLTHNYSGSYGLFRNIASFLPVLVTPAGWHLILADTEGEVYAAFASSSGRLPHTADPLDLPIEICSMIAVPHESDDVYTSVLATSPNGVLSHLYILCAPDGIQAVKILDAVKLPMCGIVADGLPGGLALLQMQSQLVFVDASASHEFLDGVLLGSEPTPFDSTTHGLRMTECMRSLTGAAPFFTTLPPIVVPGEDKEAPIIIAVTSDAVQATVLLRQTAAVDEEESMLDRTMKAVEAFKNTAVDLDASLKAVLATKKPAVKMIASASSPETELLAMLTTKIEHIESNVEVLRNAVMLISQSSVDLMGRIAAGDNNETAGDARMLTLYEGLQGLEDRLSNARRVSTAASRRANAIWNTLSSSSAAATKTEIEMEQTLRRYSDLLTDLMRAMPKLSLTLDAARREAARDIATSIPGLAATAAQKIAGEAQALQRRCDAIEKMLNPVS